MKNLLLLCVLGSMAAVFSGCDDDSLTGLAAQIKGAFGGVKVTLKSQEDECLRQQLLALRDEYQSLTGKSQATIKQRGSKYAELVLETTVQSQLITGEVMKLVYYRVVCGSNQCWNDAITAKVIGGERSFQGTTPLTQLTKGAAMSMQCQVVRDESLRKDYWTKDVDTYDRAEHHTDRAFIEGRQSGTIWLNREVATPEVSCGKKATLADLFGKDAIEYADRSGS